MSGASVRVRRARREDADALLTLEELALPDPWNRRLLANYFDDESAALWIAETDGVAIGYAIFQGAASECELLRLGVDPAWRRAGVGGELVARGLEQARTAGAAACFLEVRSDNLPARRLYERLGFRVVARRARYYGDGGDAEVYRRDLSAANG